MYCTGFIFRKARVPGSLGESLPVVTAQNTGQTTKNAGKVAAGEEGARGPFWAPSPQTGNSAFRAAWGKLQALRTSASEGAVKLVSWAGGPQEPWRRPILCLSSAQ